MAISMFAAAFELVSLPCLRIPVAQSTGAVCSPSFCEDLIPKRVTALQRVRLAEEPADNGPLRRLIGAGDDVGNTDNQGRQQPQLASPAWHSNSRLFLRVTFHCTLPLYDFQPGGSSRAQNK